MMQDGIAEQANSKVSSEDFLSIDGKIAKMDYTMLQEDESDIMSVKHLKSADRGLLTTSCDLVFSPKYVNPLSVYAVLLEVNLQQIYGRFTGTCTVDNQQVHVNSWGMFEHAYFRW